MVIIFLSVDMAFAMPYRVAIIVMAFFKDIFGTDPVVARKLADMNKHGAPEKMVRSLRRLTAFINAHQKEWQEWPSD